jgi:hypothetical protein
MFVFGQHVVPTKSLRSTILSNGCLLDCDEHGTALCVYIQCKINCYVGQACASEGLSADRGHRVLILHT